MGKPKQNPFQLPPEPRTGRALIRWTLFELPRLLDWSEGLTRGRILVLYLRAVPWILLLATGFYILSLMVLIIWELPLDFPAQFQPAVVQIFMDSPGFGERLIGLLSVTGWKFAAMLALGLALGLAGSLAGNLALGLALGLAGGLAGDLAGDLVGDLALGLAVGLAMGLAGLALGLAVDLAVGLAVGLALGLALGLASLVGGLAEGPALGIGCFSGWAIGMLRLPFYIPQAVVGLIRLDLYHNPYRWDAGVRLPIWGARRRLTEQAFGDPETGRQFAEFLLEYRPLQRRLAAAILHAAHAGRWRLGPLEPERLTPPSVPADQPAYAPGAGWQRALAGLRQDLIAARGQNQISFKRAAYDDFSRKLNAFRDLTLLESSRWNRWYLEALDAWRSEAAKALHRIEDQAASQESIAVNRYRTGTPLRPGDDQAVFFGREDLRQNLAREIMTAAEMPLFLILGQRRVGKTSLLNFLPELLGSGFVVVTQDLQDGRVESVPAWLADLRRLIADKLERDDGDWTPPDQWLAAWRELREWLEGIGADGGRKLILALDEFEELHGYLAQEPEQGRRLLAAIRSFSQHQNRVVLLFVGATPLSELRDPDWSRYFVQTQLFRVDYLARDDALRLITEPVPLRYPAAVTERLFVLTQGHPDLLQRLCGQLVSIANKKGRQAMSMADLEEAVAVVLIRDTAPIERFWNEFCRAPACRACIEQILAGEIPADRPSLMRLEEHGYLVLDQGRPRLRVPLFEDWLRKYREGFPATEC
ncbi:AAA family ATPase [Candidatus Thiosymbion oneisti]|uniref:nSTAND1 domain-containing NTPase n=1 Tax=Candidatus Thiosymbion oneisti TaxID=589554 RepID=UPI00106131B0|nr:AAA family ATPase [Candidatus Thiosymbion oneisti]